MVRGPRWSRDGLAFHHVRGERERRAGEADQRGAAELGHGEPDGFADRLQGFPGQLRQGGDVGGGADRLVQHGADAGDDVHADAGQLERDDDVGEEDGGVDVVAADRLQGDLGGQLGAQARVQHRDALADLEVFGQRAAGLAHEPDRTAGGLAAAVGGDQRGIRGAAVHQRVPGVDAPDDRCRRRWCAGTAAALGVMTSIVPKFGPKDNDSLSPARARTPARAPRRGGNHRPACAVPRRTVVLHGDEKAMMVMLWFFFLWWLPTPTSTSKPLLN